MKPLINKKIFGRVFYSTGKKGVGLVVSPHNEEFEENLEDGIKDLVKLLNDRDYPTISSCQGHGLFCKRRVAICFPDYGKYLAFLCLIKKVDIPYLRMEHHFGENFYQMDGGYNENATQEINELLGQEWRTYHVGYLMLDYDFDNDINFVDKIGRIRKAYRQIFHMRKDYRKLIKYLEKKLLPMGLLE